MNRRVWLGVLYSWVLLCSSVAISAPEKVLFGLMKLDYPPFQTLVGDQPMGPDLDMITEAFQRLPDYQLEMKLLPFKRVLHEMETGGIDVALYYKTPELLDKMLFPELPVRWSVYKIAVPVGKGFEFSTIKDLDGRRLGKLEKVPVSQEFDTAATNKDFELYEFKSFKTMLNMLNLERLEGIVGNVQIIDYMALTMDLQGRIEFLEKHVRASKELHLGVSPVAKVKSPEHLRQLLGESLRSMQEDGTVDTIYQKYGLIFDRM